MEESTDEKLRKIRFLLEEQTKNHAAVMSRMDRMENELIEVKNNIIPEKMTPRIRLATPAALNRPLRPADDDDDATIVALPPDDGARPQDDDDDNATLVPMLDGRPHEGDAPNSP